MDNIIMGMPLDWADDSDSPIFPIAAMVVVKGMDGDGEQVYSVLTTESLNVVDALGMAHFALLHAEDNTRKIILNAEG